MKPLELLNQHCEFLTDYDCFVLLAVSRKKDTPELTNSQEIVFREVIKSGKDIVRKYNKIVAQVTNYKDEDGKSYPFYLYVSLNRRDAKKAAFLLMNKMLSWIEEETKGIDRSRMFKKVYGHFYSVLMMKESMSTGQKYFMIDYDEKDTIAVFRKCLKSLDIDIELEQETKNGYHIKVKPFDRRLLQDEDFVEEYRIERPDFEVKVDANFFVEYIKNAEEFSLKPEELQKMKDNICLKCGEEMTNAYDNTSKEISPYLWECKCTPGITLSKG